LIKIHALKKKIDNKQNMAVTDVMKKCKVGKAARVCRQEAGVVGKWGRSRTPR
jgi:hypothetical protein